MNTRMCWYCNHFLTARNFFTFVCSGLTFFLLTQELYNFAITKPTSTATGEEQLRASDIPDVLACLDPGFNSSAFEKHGYMLHATFYRGSMDGDKFVGWNGNENKSSQDILEDVFLAGDNFHAKPVGNKANYQLIDPLFQKYQTYNSNIPLRIFGRTILILHQWQ